MSRAIYGAPAEALRQALDALARLAFWISWTADPDLRPDTPVSTRNMREAAAALRKAADVLDLAADLITISREIPMNHIAPLHEPLIREVPLSRLALAPENVRNPAAVIERLDNGP